MKLTRKSLRRIILEEIQKMNEDSGREEGDRYRYNAAADRYDMQHDIESGDSRKHLDNLAKDIRYDDEHIDDDGDDHHHHDHDGHDEGRKVDEVTAVTDAGDAYDVAVAQQQGADNRSQAMSIGESTENLSRGSLYRRRYYGRY